MTAELVAELRRGGPDRARVLLAGDLVLTRAELWRAVDERRADLRAAGVRAGRPVAVQVPPSVDFLATVLAALELDARPLLLHHHTTAAERASHLAGFGPVPSAAAAPGPAAFVPAVPVTVRPGGGAGPRAGDGAGDEAGDEPGVVQFTSGSTGRPKAVLRTTASLRAELDALAGSPWLAAGSETVLVLNSLVHSFGLIGGVLHGLRTGATLSFATGLLPREIGETLRRHRPTSITGVPAHADLLATLPAGALAGVGCCVSGGQLVVPAAHTAFTSKHGLGLGQAYGLTELGLVAADWAGGLAPAMGPVCAHQEVRIEAGEVLVRCPRDPYLGDHPADRWRAGWFATHDAGRLDGGVLSVTGRLDSLVAIGGLKVDLTEVEHAILSCSGVSAAVVLLDSGAVRAFVESATTSPAAVRDHCTRLSSPHKRPRLIDVRERLPRTAAGKLVRDLDRLRHPEVVR
jgi:acyl-CoA synthetase (AMP-forming)/AMP-acid ligase II